MTDDTFSVGHPFYFPTQVILLDDDPDFLEGVSLMLNKYLSCNIISIIWHGSLLTFMQKYLYSFT